MNRKKIGFMTFSFSGRNQENIKLMLANQVIKRVDNLLYLETAIASDASVDNIIERIKKGIRLKWREASDVLCFKLGNLYRTVVYESGSGEEDSGDGDKDAEICSRSGEVG